MQASFWEEGLVTLGAAIRGVGSEPGGEADRAEDMYAVADADCGLGDDLVVVASSIERMFRNQVDVDRSLSHDISGTHIGVLGKR